MKKITGLIFVLCIFVIFCSNVLADGCKPPIQFAIDNKCDLRNVDGVVNKYLCGDKFIYSDCEGRVYKMDSTIVGEPTEPQGKKWNPSWMIGLIIVEIILVIIAILIVIKIVKKRNEDKGG